MLGNPDLDSPVEDMQGTPCIRCWVSAIFKKLDTEGFEDIYTFLKNPQNFLVLSIYSQKTRFYHCEFCKIVRHLIWVTTQFLAKFSDSPWLFGTQVPWLSLTLARNELQGSHIFPNSKSKEFEEYSRQKFI